MRLVSLNASEPIEIPTASGSVRTGIFKRPVDGARMLRRLNLDGDGQADLRAHGGPNRAVYVYALEAYAFWRGELGRDDLEPGAFGENFTVEGLVDHEVRIGDRFAIGSAVVEVSQPRSPCFKLGVRLEDPQMPSRIVAASRPGFYLRVLEEGTVEAGNVFERVRREEGSLSVAVVNDLYWRDHADPERLARASAIEALSEGWRIGFSELARASTRAEAGPAWEGFRPFVIARAVCESGAVRSLYLEPQDGEPLAPHEPGQAIVVRLNGVPGADGPLLRSYTVSQPPATDVLRVTIKREGEASRFVHDALREGDVLDVAAPRGDFTVALDGERPVALISAGVGVTPMVSMLGALAAAGVPRPVWFVHSARSGAEHVLAHDVCELAADHEDVHLHVAYSAPLAEDRSESTGRLTAERLIGLLPGPDLDAYLCGPPAFAESLAQALEDWGRADPLRGVRPGRQGRRDTRPR